MKKLIAMILAAAMLLSLTACGSTAADAAADNPEAETASADASAETPPEKISCKTLDKLPQIPYNTRADGVWRSLVSRLVRDQEASGSNPDTPTKSG